MTITELDRSNFDPKLTPIRQRLEQSGLTYVTTRYSSRSVPKGKTAWVSMDFEVNSSTKFKTLLETTGSKNLFTREGEKVTFATPKWFGEYGAKIEESLHTSHCKVLRALKNQLGLDASSLA